MSGPRKILNAKKDIEHLTQNRRDEICKPPKYTAKPEDYTYVVTEYCRLKKKKNTGRRVAATTKKGDTISAKETAKEIKLIDKALEEYPNDYIEPNSTDGDIMLLSVYIFKYMIAKANRIKYPNPVVRYKHFLDSRHAKANSKITPGEFPKFTILQLLREHLMSI